MDFVTIGQEIAEFCEQSSQNVVTELGSLRIFNRPLLGVAAAEDPLFEELKYVDRIGPHHLSPKEWVADAKAVIVYFLPFSERIRVANRTAGLPAREWLYGRIEGEQFNSALREFVVRRFLDAGYAAVAPVSDGRFKVTDRRSNWSERHVAYIAGLGTFSLNCSLITKQGSAGRLGSIIVNADLVATPRLYKTRDEHCTRCGTCIMRCPPLAINERGKDHTICSNFLDRVKDLYHPRYGCGKCQTGVPCEDGIPKTKKTI